MVSEQLSYEMIKIKGEIRMDLLKKNIALLSAAAVCLSLSACGGGGTDIGGDDDVGRDWRTWGIIQSDGTITRNGEDTEVLVCVNKKASNFYYDTDSQTLFDGVEYPPALADKLAPAEDVWAMYKSTDFSDLNGDGNTDVTMWFDDNGSEIKAVWFWDTENAQFIYQPNESDLGDEGRGDIIRDDGETFPVLMGGALPFSNMETLKSESSEDGTYYHADVTEDGQIMVVNTALLRDWGDDVQSVEDYLTACAVSLGETDSYELQSVEQNDEYTQKMTYPVYIVTYTASESENVREWIVYAMDTDTHTYLYGFCAAPDAAEEMTSVSRDIFSGLYLE